MQSVNIWRLQRIDVLCKYPDNLVSHQKLHLLASCLAAQRAMHVRRNNAKNEPLNLHFGILTQVWEKVTYSSWIFPEYRLQRLGIEVVKIDATSEVKIFLYDAALRHLWYHPYCFRILVTSNLRGQLLSLIFEYISHVFSIHGISVFLFLQAVSLH